MPTLLEVRPPPSSSHHPNSNGSLVPLATVRLPTALLALLEETNSSSSSSSQPSASVVTFDPNVISVSNQSFGFRLAPVNGEEEEDDDKEQDSAVPPTADILRRTLSTNGTPAEVHLFAQLAHRVKVDKKPITTSGASGTDERPNGNGNQKKKKSGNVSSGSVSPESAVLQDEDLPLAARVAAASSALSSSTTALTSEQEKRILHLLAVKGPLTQPNIATAVKLRQDSLPTYLSTVAVLNKKSGKWDLKPESFKQVDVVGWKLYDAKERETAAKRAKEAFQSLGLSNSAPELKRISSLLSAAGGDSSASGGSSGRATPITPGEDLAPTSTSTKRKDLDAADGERERDSSSSTPPDAPHGLSMKRPRLSHTDSNDAPSPAGTADGDSKRKLPRFKRSVSAVVSSPVPTHSESPSGVGAGAGPSGWGGVSPGDAKIGESGANKSRRDKEKDKEKSERGKDKERDSKRGASTIDRYVPSTTRSRSRSVSRSRGPRSRSGSRRLRSRSRSRSRDRDRRRNRSRGRDRSRSRSRSRDRRGDRGRDSYREKEREREREKEKDRGRASGSAKGSGRESGRESGKQDSGSPASTNPNPTNPPPATTTTTTSNANPNPITSEQEYNDLSYQYRSKHTEALDLSKRIDTIRANFRKRRTELENQLSGKQDKAKIEEMLVEEFAERVTRLEALQAEYTKVREELAELRKRFE